MITVRVPNFTPSRHGFPFVNSFPWGTPALEFATPLGRIAIGNAGAGLCGGMVFSAIDFHAHSVPIPTAPEPPVFRYLVRRQIASWNLPFGATKYYDWQRRPGASKMVAGRRVIDGLTRLTILREWPRIRAELDAGRLAPLGLVLESGYGLRKLVRNHQILSYGYDLVSGEVTLRIYDPNYPEDDDATLTFRLREPDAEQRFIHSCEGPTVRGFFLTRYRKPSIIPTF